MSSHQKLDAFVCWFRQVVSDGFDPSTNRVIVFLTVPPAVLIPLFVWIGASINAGKLADIPAGVVQFTVGVCTVLMGALYLNKREEGKASTPAQQPPTI